MIPYLDLHALNAPYEADIKQALLDVVDSGWYLFGQQVTAFEQEWAAYTRHRHCVACANGLDALRLVLRAWIEMGTLHPGDEVIVPANTYIASILAVSDNGLMPVPVEPDEETYLLDPLKFEAAITPRTRAILPVHLYGQQCDMAAIMQVAEAHGLLVLEDCAQSHGASPRVAGSTQAYSFYPGKNLGALGDAGAVCTDDEALATVVRQIAFYGSTVKYSHRYKGLNSRMDELQASVLRIKLRELDRTNARRQAVAARYDREITNPLVQKPVCRASHVYHIYPVLCGQRDLLQQYLWEQGIMTQIHYPIAPHRQEAYCEWAGRSYPITERIAAQELSLPCNQMMTDDEVSQVIAAINSFGK